MTEPWMSKINYHSYSYTYPHLSKHKCWEKYQETPGMVDAPAANGAAIIWNNKNTKTDKAWCNTKIACTCKAESKNML